MKRTIILILAAFIGIGMYAQMPQGGGFGGRGGQGGFGGGGRMGGGPQSGGRGGFNQQRMEETPILEHFPEIPNLTLEQRTDVGIILGDEQKALRKLESQKRELFEKDREKGITEQDTKQIEKTGKKIAKIDTKIQKQIEKSNKKIQKKLSAEQYQVFLDKRSEFRFEMKRPPMMRQPEGRGAPGERPEMGQPGFGQDF
ncbi:MAG: hypothetical protein LBR67_09190 [Dysgonamonadaceae bacterium]|jgi:hypothetical protein|nr:hypothetical protein [Dysgonamonadaceae bacterium]